MNCTNKKAGGGITENDGNSTKTSEVVAGIADTIAISGESINDVRELVVTSAVSAETAVSEQTGQN